jgi:uncharacterized protein YuzE
MSHDVYARYSNAAVVRTRVLMVDGAHTEIMVDLDAEGGVVGVELIDVEAVVMDGRLATPVYEIRPGGSLPE